MNVLMPIAATGAPSTSAAPLPAVSAAPREPASALPFERTLQQIVLGAGALAVDATLTDPVPAQGLLGDVPVTDPLLGAAIGAPSLAAPEAEDATSGPVPDLLLSGMLLQPPAMTTTQPATPPATAPQALSPTPGQPQAPLAGLMPGLALPASPSSPSSPASQGAATSPDNGQPAAVQAAPTPQAAAAVVTAANDPRRAPAQQPARLPLADADTPTAFERPLSAAPSTAVDSTALPSRFAAPTGLTSSTAPAPAQAHPLMQALGERIALHMQRGSERVVIRLDPPMSGHIEINIRQDAMGVTQVQLSGSSHELVRQLQTISDGLRQELVHRQPGEVNVQVAHSAREQDGRQQRQEREAAQADEPGRALDDQESQEQHQRFALAEDRGGRA